MKHIVSRICLSVFILSLFTTLVSCTDGTEELSHMSQQQKKVSFLLVSQDILEEYCNNSDVYPQGLYLKSDSDGEKLVYDNCQVKFNCTEGFEKSEVKVVLNGDFRESLRISESGSRLEYNVNVNMFMDVYIDGKYQYDTHIEIKGKSTFYDLKSLKLMIDGVTFFVTEEDIENVSFDPLFTYIPISPVCSENSFF